jgi:glyoxylase-like metal-dependent hydrolase (beta-lactamase superfamily II)
VADITVICPGFWGNANWGEARNENLIFGISSVLLIEANKRILYDTGHYGMRPFLIQRLKDLKIQPRDIDAVVVSHFHWDHALNLEMFPDSEFIIHERLLETAPNAPESDWAIIRDTSFFKGKRVREVRENDEIAEGVKVLETIGHTAADISLAVDTKDGLAVMTSDAVTNAASLLAEKPAKVFFDEAHAVESVRKVKALADVVYPGHERPFKRLEDGSYEYLMDADFQLIIRQWFGNGTDFTVDVKAPRHLNRY